jgi:hypothetical protein
MFFSLAALKNRLTLTSQVNQGNKVDTAIIIGILKLDLECKMSRGIR